MLVTLPDALVQAILEWLGPMDFVELNLAHSCKRERPKWLGCLSDSYFVIPNSSIRAEEVRRSKPDTKSRFLQFLCKYNVGVQKIFVPHDIKDVASVLESWDCPAIQQRVRVLELQMRGKEASKLEKHLRALSMFEEVRDVELNGGVAIPEFDDFAVLQAVYRFFPRINSLKLMLNNYAMVAANSQLFVRRFCHLQKISITIMEMNFDAYDTLLLHPPHQFPNLTSLYIGPMEYPRFLINEALEISTFESFVAHVTTVAVSVGASNFPCLRKLGGDFTVIFPFMLLVSPQLQSLRIEGDCSLNRLGSYEQHAWVDACVRLLNTCWDTLGPRDTPPFTQLHTLAVEFSGLRGQSLEPVKLDRFIYSCRHTLRQLDLQGLTFSTVHMCELFNTPSDHRSDDSSDAAAVTGFPVLHIFKWDPDIILHAPEDGKDLGNFHRCLVRSCPVLSTYQYFGTRETTVQCGDLAAPSSLSGHVLPLRNLTIEHTGALYYIPADVSHLGKFTNLQSLRLNGIRDFGITEDAIIGALTKLHRLEYLYIEQARDRYITCSKELLTCIGKNNRHLRRAELLMNFAVPTRASAATTATDITAVIKHLPYIQYFSMIVPGSYVGYLRDALLSYNPKCMPTLIVIPGPN